MRTVIFIMLMCIYSYATINETYKLRLSAQEIEKIKQSSKKNSIIKRFKQYKQLTKKIQDYSTFKQLSHVNAFFNKILPKHDKAKYGINDYWTTQKEFLFIGRGDCEDYVISKYFTLLEIGIPKEHLYLGIVQVKGERNNHMVLLYLKNKDDIPLVMDNLSFKVVPLNKRKRLIQKIAFNEFGSYKIKNDRLDIPVKINWKGDNKWQRILDRVYVNNE